jgi:NADPH:quinone reductase-like Zn-dependent oxidoreductase
MKAVYQTRYGKLEVMEYGDRQSQEIGPHEVLVENHATSVNPRDWLTRSGRYQLQLLVPSFPLILGSESQLLSAIHAGTTPPAPAD